MRIESRGSSLVLTGNIAANFILLGQLPATKKWDGRSLVFKPCGAAIEYILTHWPESVWVNGAERTRDEWLKVKMAEENTRADKHADLVDESGYEFKTKPFAHQLKAFILGRRNRNFAYLHEQGCGKTKVAIDDFAYNFEADLVDALVIIAPNGVHSNWIINEVPDHLPDRISRACVAYAANLTKREIEDARRLAIQKPVTRAARVFAFNVEGFVSQKAKDLLESILKHHRCMVVVDESNCIQNNSAMRTKYLTKACAKVAFKRIMTGTPLTNGVENLFSQFRFLDPNIIGYSSFFAFRAKFCIMGGFEQRQIVGYRCTEELATIVDGNSHRVLKKDCLDLPEKLYKRHKFEMLPAQKKAYEAVRKGALDDLELLFGEGKGQELAQELAISRLIRLQQISSGWTPHSSGETAIPICEGNNPRLEALEALLANADGKVIIWVNATGSVADIAAIGRMIYREKLGGHVEYHGSISTGDRELAISRFQRDKGIKFFLASRAACAGLTLTAADQAMYYSNNFDLRIRLQSEDRNHRIGSEIHQHILYTDIHTTGIDEKIVKSLRAKKSVADLITRDPKSLFMEPA